MEPKPIKQHSTIPMAIRAHTTLCLWPTVQCGNDTALQNVVATAPTNPPVADFQLGATAFCPGTSVTFSNSSQDAVTFQWTFDEGSPNTSTNEHPTVIYNTPEFTMFP